MLTGLEWYDILPDSARRAGSTQHCHTLLKHALYLMGKSASAYSDGARVQMPGVNEITRFSYASASQ